MGFIINEDKALKDMLTGITVSDEKNEARPVGVWFGQPDIEIRQQAYPYITIELIDAQEALDRSMRGSMTLEAMGYVPEGFTAPSEGTYQRLREYPIPYNLDYQITTYARQPRHDRQIMAKLISDVLPTRYRSLYIPEDDTVRAMYVLQQFKRDRTEQERRLFSNIFNVRVHSEIYLGSQQSVPEVISVAISVNHTTGLLSDIIPEESGLI